ncbi:MAG: SH3 domain-containing protein, partial [Clostridiales bacterium]|nr:SH3 domain-containing protein [Clostridiales bacterium]
SYDYAALGEHADYLMIMAYDESWQGGDAGPVASAGFVENSIKYALQFVPAEKLVVGVPFYGRIWSEDAAFNGNGISLAALQSVIEDYNADVTYDETYQSPVARFTVREGDVSHSVNGKTLTPGNYTIWFEDEQSLEAKVRLIHDYDLKGMGSWALNQATDSMLGNLGNWLNAAEENTAVGYVTASSLRVREAPNTDSNIIAYYSEGDTVTLIGEEENGWYKLRLSDGKNGYVSALYISLTPPVAVRTGYVTADRLNVRQSASTSGTVLTVITEGTALTVLGGEQDGWYRVELADSTAGYVSAQYIAFTAPAVRKTGYAAALGNVRQSANSGGTILTTVAPGTQFTVVGDAVDGWYRVELANGTAGFILADNVTFTKPAADRTGYVTASVLNVRKSASTSSSILTTVTNGTALTVHGEAANGWYQVTLSNGTAGYVSAQYIAFTAPNPAKTGYVTASVLNVRKSASTSSAIVTTLARNTAVTITGSLSNNFYPVRLANGTTGYVSADYITFTNPAGSAKTGTVTASTLNIRKSASTSSTIVTTVKKGASLTVTGSAVSGFYPVRLANGTTGYASTQYVTVK